MTASDPAAPARDQLLALSDEELLAHCRTDRFRGSGRGGQKRNVTDSAIRVTHLASGLFAASDKTRSQAQNRQEALRLLRLEIALQWREPPPESWPWSKPPGLGNAAYPRWSAAVLDVLAAVEFRVSEAATFCGLSTGRFIKDLCRDPALWQLVNRRRRDLGLAPLKSH